MNGDSIRQQQLLQQADAAVYAYPGLNICQNCGHCMTAHTHSQPTQNVIRHPCPVTEIMAEIMKTHNDFLATDQRITELLVDTSKHIAAMHEDIAKVRTCTSIGRITGNIEDVDLTGAWWDLEEDWYDGSWDRSWSPPYQAPREDVNENEGKGGDEGEEKREKSEDENEERRVDSSE